jgi:glycosyltransferase involved in cell wall biosynthesis
VYDVSVLGIAYQHQAARAGIFRVVDRLARGLNGALPGQLAFSAVETPQTLRDARRYLAGQPELAAVPLLSPRRGVRAGRMLEGAVGALGTGADIAFARRGLRRVMLGLEARTAVPAWGVGEADVFHSPHSALPRPPRGGRGPRRILTVYDTIPLRFPQFFPEPQVRRMRAIYGSLQPDDWAIAISESTKRDLCEDCGVDPDRVLVTPLAADPHVFHPDAPPAAIGAARSRYGVPTGEYLLAVNTLEPRKNLGRAIRAFAQLVRRGAARNTSLVLVGARGWKTEGLDSALAEAGPARDRIVLAGYVADADLAALYGGATAFVYPSLYEGFGLPPLEAMQCGVPVVTSNTSSLPEVVGDAGLMVDPEDVDALAEALAAVLHDPALRATMRARSLARAALFSWDRCVRLTVAAYHTAAAA